MKKVFSLLIVLFILASCERKVKDKYNDELAINTEELAAQPNVIVILLDDAGYVDFGFMGSEDLKTPRIDELASDGIVFTDAHVSATVCAPSRAGIITGRYQQEFGFEANDTGFGTSGDIGLAKDVTTIADAFKSNGYQTIALGKWHLGGEAHNHPNQRGFNEFFGFLGGSRSYFPIKNPNKLNALQHNGTQISFDGYLTDVLGDRSVQYVEENKNQPFFMYLSYNAVHTPMHAKEEDLKKFEGHPRHTLAAMTWSLDENIGKLRDKLSELGLLDNTLIYLLSDNGGAYENDSSSGPLKGWKGNKFEGGHRVPFVMSWPAQLPKGKIFDGLTSALDIYTTSLAAAGISIKEEEANKLDGTNLLPYLQNRKQGHPHKKLFWRKLDESAVRMGNYKIISLDGFGSTMYDLANDLGETTDLSKKEPETFRQLMSEFRNWEETIMDPLWDEPENWKEVTYHIHEQLMKNEEVKYQTPKEKKKYLNEKKLSSSNRN